MRTTWKYALALVLIAAALQTQKAAAAAWVDDFNNSDPLTNTTATGWTASFIRPGFNSQPNMPSSIGDTDTSDDYTYLAEPGRIDSSVTLRSAHDGVNPGTLTLSTSSPLPQLDFLSGATRLQIIDWNGGPVNNGTLGGGQSLTNAMGTIAGSTTAARAGESNDEIWFRHDFSATSSISFFNKINGVNANASGTRTDFYGVTPATNVIPWLTDSAGDFAYPNTFWPTTTELVQLTFDVQLDPTNVSVTVSAVSPINQNTYSSQLAWAHGLTAADWDAGTAGSIVRLQAYANLAASPTNIRGTDLTVGKIIAGIETTLDGDFNSDGKVDAADYTVWRDGLGSTYDETHYALWKANFGAGSGSGGVAAGAAVPEPATWCGLLLAITALAWDRRRRRSNQQA
jgi:hypothetical protein